MANARVLDEHGRFGAPVDIAWRDGRFVGTDGAPGAPSADAGGDTGTATIDGSGRWLIPGLVDAHTHAAWQAFDAADRDAIPEAEAVELTRRALHAMLLRGTTSVRDAGGLRSDSLRAIEVDARPRVQTAEVLIDREAADAAGGVERAAEAALVAGARWIKLVGTAGVASPQGSRLDPVFSLDETTAAVRLAAQTGAGVMVHAWGGAAVDHAIEAGAASIEHGMFLTAAQAARAAERGLVLVPTLRIYRQVRGMIDAGELPGAFGPRVDEAVAAHPGAVRTARDAGLRIALGSDSGTPEQHRTALREFAALVEAGLTPEDALVAATRTGAELLAAVAGPGSPAPSGRIAPGEIADAVLLNVDPSDPANRDAIGDPSAVDAVILGGRTILPRAADLDP
ncbi:amidohydrolase family protein [Leucobacter iarius]|uniref:Amidohydrolase family protein n=1 Tax=Leucobacter iarius TaxID=333963 RepID=A0ABN2L9X9_9MICO